MRKFNSIPLMITWAHMIAIAITSRKTIVLKASTIELMLSLGISIPKASEQQKGFQMKFVLPYRKRFTSVPSL